MHKITFTASSEEDKISKLWKIQLQNAYYDVEKEIEPFDVRFYMNELLQQLGFFQFPGHFAAAGSGITRDCSAR